MYVRIYKRVIPVFKLSLNRITCTTLGTWFFCSVLCLWSVYSSNSFIWALYNVIILLWSHVPFICTLVNECLGRFQSSLWQPNDHYILFVIMCYQNLLQGVGIVQRAWPSLTLLDRGKFHSKAVSKHSHQHKWETCCSLSSSTEL